ncbi:hypothetical protein DAPPUDRAFT_274735 [Daphnia pulex]|uniref:Uncharacterized protein n=1 Tax=Daphnia pulex TaxID=6669 RepID=E9I4N0_DAPPU|nr:hypothetical protein DAPPUDRAFT_274735 [Daphnia pulex]|eukprot:EFX61048.1 hypothetical protein DAPPUDRAFT_274735 [Daphnia pulex]
MMGQTPMSEEEKCEMFKTFRRGQCFAIVSKRRPDKTEGTIYNRDFGLLRLEWFLERGPEEPFDYSDFEMYAFFDGLRILPPLDLVYEVQKWRPFLNLKDIISMERYPRKEFEVYSSDFRVGNYFHSIPIGRVHVRGDRGSDTGDEDTEDEDTSAALFQAKRQERDLEQSFDSNPDSDGVDDWLEQRVRRARLLWQARLLMCESRNNITSMHAQSDEEVTEELRNAVSGAPYFIQWVQRSDNNVYSAYAYFKGKVLVDACEENGESQGGFGVFAGYVVYPKEEVDKDNFVVNVKHTLNIRSVSVVVMDRVKKVMEAYLDYESTTSGALRAPSVEYDVVEEEKDLQQLYDEEMKLLEQEQIQKEVADLEEELMRAESSSDNSDL